MAVTLFASGTQAATVTTEHFLSSPNVAGKFVVQIDLVNMVAGDVVELRAYKMVLTGGTSRVVSFAQFAGAQPTDALIAISEAMANTLTDANAVRFSLKQTFGTSRNFPWAVLNEEDATTVVSANLTQVDGVANGTHASGQVPADVRGWLGTAPNTPTVAGVPNVNTKTWNDLTTVALPLVPTTAGRTLDVSVGGEAGVDWANVGSPTTAQNLSATNIDPDQIIASVSGAVGSVTGAVGSVAAGGITAASIATDAIDADALAADAVNEIADGVWDEDATGHQVQGTFGQAIGDPVADADTIWGLVNTNLDAAVSSRASAAALATVQSDTDDIQTRLPAALVGGRMDSSVGAYASGMTPTRPSASGTADSGSTTTVVDTERTEADTDYWKGHVIKFTNGTLAGQSRLITAFNAATDTLTFAPALTVAAGTHTYEIYALSRVDLHFVAGDVINALIAGRVDANAQVVGDKTGYAVGVGGIAATAFAAGAIDAAAIAADAIGATEIANGAIDAATFAAGAIDNAAFNVTETLTANPAAGGIVAASFGAGAIDATAFAQGAADKVWATTARTLTSGVVKKNAIFNNLEFLMVDSTDHVTPKTGLVVTGTKSIDGAAFAAVTGAIAEVANGIYQIDLSAADTNGDVVTYRFTGAAADDTFVTIITSV